MGAISCDLIATEELNLNSFCRSIDLDENVCDFKDLISCHEPSLIGFWPDQWVKHSAISPFPGKTVLGWGNVAIKVY